MVVRKTTIGCFSARTIEILAELGDAVARHNLNLAATVCWTGLVLRARKIQEKKVVSGRAQVKIVRISSANGAII